MSEIELDKLREEHQPYRSQVGTSWTNCKTCSALNSGQFSGGVRWPCIIIKLVNRLDTELNFSVGIGDLLAKTEAELDECRSMQANRG